MPSIVLGPFVGGAKGPGGTPTPTAEGSPVGLLLAITTTEAPTPTPTPGGTPMGLLLSLTKES